MALTVPQCFAKRFFDLIFSAFLLICFSWLIFLLWFVAYAQTGQNGFFCQTRIGRSGKPFVIYKIRTMFPGSTSSTTLWRDPRITPSGCIIRALKLDELPQLINILLGDMSFVGPRPDVPGFADMLSGSDSIILTLRPGITGLASLVYRNEAKLLAHVSDPIFYSRNYFWPDKVRLNKIYFDRWSLILDLKILFYTLLPQSFLSSPLFCRFLPLPF